MESHGDGRGTRRGYHGTQTHSLGGAGEILSSTNGGEQRIDEGEGSPRGDRRNGPSKGPTTGDWPTGQRRMRPPWEEATPDTDKGLAAASGGVAKAEPAPTPSEERTTPLGWGQPESEANLGGSQTMK